MSCQEEFDHLRHTLSPLSRMNAHERHEPVRVISRLILHDGHVGGAGEHPTIRLVGKERLALSLEWDSSHFMTAISLISRRCAVLLYYRSWAGLQYQINASRQERRQMER